MKRQVETILHEEIEIEFSVMEEGPRKQVGLLGGNFNPVHTGHLIVADQVCQQLGLDEVRLMPTFLPPHVDEKKTIAAKYRLEMLELAIADNPHLKIETYEIEKGGKSYSYETIKALKEREPRTDFYFIIGGDMVEYLPKWYRIDELVTMIQFVAVKRPGYPEDSPYPVCWVDTPMIDISSSMIRKKVSHGCSIHYLVPESVEKYIFEKRLYENDGYA